MSLARRTHVAGSSAAKEIPSQILRDEPRMRGDLAIACANLRPNRVRLEMFPAEPTKDHTGTEHVDPPICGWSIEADGKSADGPLATMSFISVWNNDERVIDDIAVDLVLHQPKWAAAMPFVHFHPSGFLMAVRYDAPSGNFMRSILYPLR